MRGVAGGQAALEPTAPPSQGGSRRYVLDEVLATNRATGTYSAGTALARTSIPSARLHHKVTIGFKGFTTETVDFPQSGVGMWGIAIQEWARTARGIYVPGAQLVTNLAAPNSWEAVTLSRQWRIAVTVPTQHEGDEGPVAGTGLAAAGQLIIVAEWEPAAGDDISDRDLANLFAACHLEVQSAPIVSSTGT